MVKSCARITMASSLIVTIGFELFDFYTIEKTDSLRDGTLFKTTQDTLSVDRDSVEVYESEEIRKAVTAITLLDPFSKRGISALLFAPNPVSRESEGTNFVIPSNLKGTWNIDIFDIVGNHIDGAQITSSGGESYQWDLRNQSGDRVATGTYIALIRYKLKDGTVQQLKTAIGVYQ